MAKDAGLKKGDKIRSLNGKATFTAHDLDAFAYHHPGDWLHLVVQRGEKILAINVESAELTGAIPGYLRVVPEMGPRVRGGLSWSLWPTDTELAQVAAGGSLWLHVYTYEYGWPVVAAYLGSPVPPSATLHVQLTAPAGAKLDLETCDPATCKRAVAAIALPGDVPCTGMGFETDANGPTDRPRLGQGLVLTLADGRRVVGNVRIVYPEDTVVRSGMPKPELTVTDADVQSVADGRVVKLPMTDAQGHTYAVLTLERVEKPAG
jgi:hypothetical protein